MLLWKVLSRSEIAVLLKVRPHYATWHTAVHSGTAWQGRTAKVTPCHKYMWTLRQLGCGMLFDAAQPKNSLGKLSVPLKEAAQHMMSKGFQSGISQFEKKIRQSSPISFHGFYNLKKVCKKIFFHVDAIALAAYAEQLLPRSKAAVCCILPHGIVWTHLKALTSEQGTTRSRTGKFWTVGGMLCSSSNSVTWHNL